MSRWLLSHDSPEPTPRLEAALRHPEVAGLRFVGAALRRADDLRRLCDLVRAAGAAEPRSAEEIPKLVVLDTADLGADLPADGEIPPPPDADRLAAELEAGGAELEITLEVLDWARQIAALGVDLVFSPSLAPPLAEDPPPGLVGAWTDALHAAGLIAAPGPLGAAALRADEASDAWRPAAETLVHGAEVLRLAEPVDGETVGSLRRDKGVDAVLVGPGAGADLVELDGAELPEPTAIYDEADRRVDRLRLEWLL